MNVCGVVIEDGEVLHPELPQDVADALVAYAAGVARLRTKLHVGDTRKTAPNEESHTSVLTRASAAPSTPCASTRSSLLRTAAQRAGEARPVPRLAAAAGLPPCLTAPFSVAGGGSGEEGRINPGLS